jgi:hypothetical protein
LFGAGLNVRDWLYVKDHRLAVEAGRKKIRDLRVLGPDRFLQAVERLRDDLVGANLTGNSRVSRAADGRIVPAGLDGESH